MAYKLERGCWNKKFFPQIVHILSCITFQVGPTYGRKTMTGLLSSEGIHVSEQRVGESLKRVNPGYSHARRTSTARQLNPVPYRADYFGHKLHIDQNEKLVMYGVTHMWHRWL